MNASPETETWWLYLLLCSDNSIYVGIAKDADARFEMHRHGRGARYTRIHPPVRLLARQPFPDYRSAAQAERATKRLTPVQKRELARSLGATERSLFVCQLESTG
ncbi:GIY-YIG nuclease family protein [Burkholderia ubonensis]|uniref:GIY-YIG nuclease family protein n=1 Tax=Burkholderia ubonensis TaxID=101571 RepID=UPI0009B3B6A8|nr:GIY-YIG nuclease family protein [Burkholderia ubonensis]